MSSTTVIAPGHSHTVDAVVIDFLYLDLTTCGRCVGTDRNLSTALGMVEEVLRHGGRQVEVRKQLVETAEQARRLHLVSSPTLRVNGRDVAVQLKETSCGAEACADGCGDHIQCRVWTYRGVDYTEAPVGLIVDAILGEVYRTDTASASDPGDPYSLPDNLHRFFAGKPEQAGPKPVTIVDSGAVDTGPVGLLFTGGESDLLRPGGQGRLLRRLFDVGVRLPMTAATGYVPVDTAAVWRQLHDPLLGYISRRVGAADAEDVLQEIMLRVHRHQDDLPRLERVTGWIFRVASNAIVDYYRNPARRERPIGTDVDPGWPTGNPTPPEDLDSPDLRADLANCLTPMVDLLPAKYREAILLTEYQGMTQTAAAAHVGLSVPGMKARVQRARRQLKQLLTECCDVELDRRHAITSFHARTDGCGCGCT